MIDPCGNWHGDAGRLVKGTPVRVFANQGLNALSDVAVDCREFNAVAVAVFVGGSTPSATISIEGSDGQGGNYLPLSDTNASKAVTSNASFDAIVGAAWVRARISNLTGGTFTIVITPYVSPGSSSIAITGAVDVVESSGSGVIATPTPTVVNVATTSTLVLAANASRQHVLIVNDSEVEIYLGLGTLAALHQGIRLNGSGSAYEMSAKAGNLYRGVIYAIHGDTGTKALLVEEGV